MIQLRRLICFTFLLLLCALAQQSFAAQRWSTKLDGDIRFYQSTELGVLVVGTEKSLYAVDGETGDILWRRKNVKLDGTDVAAVPGTDILLMNLQSDNKTRVEAADLMTGDTLWHSDKVRGSVMQMALDQNTNRLALVFVRDARDKPRDGFKRKPVVHVFDLSAGKELWKYELESDVEMMPARWKDGEDVPYTLDNYRAPVFLSGRLYLFYEGVTSLDAATGKARQREKFRVNEEGLALTEGDPVADERHLYVSGRGHVRAISRSSGDTVWEAKDLGSVPEMVLTRDVLYVRTGGQFAGLQDGETVSRGPYGVSAIDLKKGKVLWRYKGADKGITNFGLLDANTIVLADRDDLIVLDTATGKRRSKTSHHVKNAAFVLLNERGEGVIGGTNEVAAFDFASGREVWRSRHDPPGRGVLRTIAAVAARATALYFRYGGAATTAFRGIQLVNAITSVRWSGLAVREALPSLTSLASDYGREYVRDRITSFGMLSRARQISSLGRSGIPRPSIDSIPRPSMDSLPRPSVDVEERLMDQLDPAHQLERLSRYLWRRRRLATLRGHWMYFYTGLSRGNGLAGVNVNTGAVERAIRLGSLDERFVSDEAADLLYTSENNRLLAYALNERN